ncbi:MAG: enoyl-CoA hydratase/isomerase family protein [Chloroflexi bacterium]|nr:enoyl-CoA hydratase/isomerase family protein [Chloroflexota bacterium]
MNTEKKHVVLERVDGVARIIFNRPQKRNPLSHELLADVAECLDEVRHDDSVGAVITTGAGDVAYSAGRDISNLIDGYEHMAEGPARQKSRPDVREMIRTFPKVTIAAVNGYCLGGAMGIMLVHDITIASEENAKFGLPEIFRGFLAKGPIPVMLRYMPPKFAFDMLLTGENWDARRALQAGIVSRVVPHKDLQKEALRIAKLVAGWDPLTVQYTKRACHACMDQLTYKQAIEVGGYIHDEHNVVNQRALAGAKDFIAGKGIKATF